MDSERRGGKRRDNSLVALGLPGLGLSLCLLICLAALTLITGHLQANRWDSERLLTAPPLSRLDTRFLNVMTLGYRRLYDDFMDIWLVQELTGVTAATNTPLLARMVHSGTRHGPKDEPLYLLACFVLGLDLHAPELCEEIAQDGMRALPESWRIPMTVGYLCAFKLNDRSCAASYYALAASRPGAPTFLASYAAKLRDQAELSPEELKASVDELMRGEGTGQLGGHLATPAVAP